MDIIDQIENIRRKNNKNWMDILRIAFHYAPDETKIIMGDIVNNDAEINELSRKLAQA